MNFHYSRASMRFGWVAVVALNLLVPAVAVGWGIVHGNGKAVTQERKLPPFNQIEMKGSLDAQVVPGPHKVEVTIDENLQELVEISVEGETLIIRAKRGFSTQLQNRIAITMPDLKGVKLQGSGSAAISGFNKAREVALAVSGSGDVKFDGQAQTLAVAIRGSGDVTLSGSTDSLQGSVSGSGGLQAKKMTARSATLSVAGSGNVAATVKGGTVTAALTGSGDIDLWGDAKVTQVAKSGSGDLTQHGG
jgi:hypothetical protein